jgi:N-acetylmuramic acid 6-phosphate (MurNAc-6-P) etherase
MQQLRHTERSHPLTQDLDQCSVSQMLSSLQKAEQDLWQPNAWSESLNHKAFLSNFHEAQRRIRACLEHPQGRVLMGGAGTSGRLALIAAHQSRHPRIKGLLAGGIDAFFRAKENVEDSPQAGIADLEPELANGPLVYIGISCGLSAAYVAGQIHRTLQHPQGYAILLGFNRSEDANARKLPGIEQSMADLIAALEAKPERGLLLNPIIGPEPITGSTRMKGGSATKLILDGLLNQQWFEFELIAEMHRETYSCLQQQVEIIEKTGDVLARGGRLLYCSDDEAACFTMLDASECPPTFGAFPDQIWSYGSEKPVLSGFDMSSFRLQDLPASERRPSILLSMPGTSARVIEKLNAWTRLQPEAMHLRFACPDKLWRASLLGQPGLIQKWILNAITTLSFVCAGKIFGNRMIDLRISNLKLWDRGCRIISEIAGVSLPEAEARMIAVLEEKQSTSLNHDELIRAAKDMPLIPLVILIKKGKITLSQAQILLAQKPRVAAALEHLAGLTD